MHIKVQVIYSICVLDSEAIRIHLNDSQVLDSNYSIIILIMMVINSQILLIPTSSDKCTFNLAKKNNKLNK